MRLAASLAIDRKTINQALTLGHSQAHRQHHSGQLRILLAAAGARLSIRPMAKKLLAEAGHPNGFDAGDYYCDATYANLGEAVINNLQAVGIRAKLRPLERAAFFKEYSEKKLKNIIQAASGAFGNTATRLEAFVVKGGTYVYGSYPDIDELFQQQAAELDSKKREAILHKVQQLVHERTMFARIWQLAFINGAGPAGRGVGPRPDRGPRLLGALRGRHAEGQVGNRGGRHMQRRLRAGLAIRVPSPRCRPSARPAGMRTACSHLATRTA